MRIAEMSGGGVRRAARRLATAALAGMALSASAQAPAPNAGAQKQLDQMMRNPQLQEMMNQAAAQGQARAAAQATPPPAPAHDPARLARVSRTVMSADAVRGHIAAVQAALLQRQPAAQRQGTLDLVAALKGQPGEPAHAASQAWLMGLPDLGLLLMGQACVDNPANVDAQNNFAAFLTMLGGEPQAVPILLRLATDFPANATVQNNLGQAWYGLGDKAEAEKHLKAAVHLFPGHSQAEETLADIDEARGDPSAAAADLTASLQSAYSPEKVDRLKRLGAAPDLLKMPFHLPHPPDPMGLEQFTLPAFCSGLDDSPACSARWQAFRADLDTRRGPIDARIAALQKEIEKRMTPSKKISEQSTLAEKMAAAQEIVGKTGMDHPPPLLAVVQPRFHEAFDRVAGLSATLEKETGPLQTRYNAAKMGFGARLGAIEKRYASQWGEGQGAGLERQHCDEVNALFDEEAHSLNPMLETISTVGRSRVIKAYNDEVFYAQYVYDDPGFQLMKSRAQQMFLGWLGAQHAEPTGPRCGPPKPPPHATSHLQDFYDLHCDNIIRFDTHVFGSFEVRCNKMTSHLNIAVPLPGIKVGFKGTMVDNLDTGEFIRGTAELGVSGGTKVSAGPVDVGVGASGGGYIEMDGNGISDVGVQGGVSAGAGPIGASADGRIGWNAGGSGSAKGTLGGFTVAAH